MVQLLTEAPDGSGRRRSNDWRDGNYWRRSNHWARQERCRLPWNAWSSPQSRVARSNDGRDAHPDRTKVFFHFPEFADAFDDFI